MCCLGLSGWFLSLPMRSWQAGALSWARCHGQFEGFGLRCTHLRFPREPAVHTITSVPIHNPKSLYYQHQPHVVPLGLQHAGDGDTLRPVPQPVRSSWYQPTREILDVCRGSCPTCHFWKDGIVKKPKGKDCALSCHCPLVSGKPMCVGLW